LLRQHTGCRRGATIRLVKRIPLAAGLAGGSTDAAATLAGLNRLWGLNVPGAQLAELSSRLGSDIPFFFAVPAAWCSGLGEKVGPESLVRPLDLVLIGPPQGLSTAAVYGGVTVPDRPQSGDDIRQALRQGDTEGLGRLLFNRLQPAAMSLYPALGDYLARL